MKIPVAKPFLTEEEAQSAYDTILSGWVTQGPRVEEFETEFKNYVGSQYAVAVSNCTTALHLSLLIAGVGEGDDVICPSLSFIATANAIRYVGANPIFAEVNQHYNLDINDVRKRITSKTKAIILVHQIGMPADIDSFQELCDENGIQLIEDAACAIGSSYKNKKIGSHSDLVCFSFHPRKVITTGDGGMITTNSKEVYERLKLLRQHGMSINDRERHGSKKVIFEEYVELGYNYRLTDIQASIGIIQLKKLDALVDQRRRIAHRYNDAFKEVEFFRLPVEESGYFSNYQSYSVYIHQKCPISRNDLMQALLDRGISTRRGVMNSHEEPVYKSNSTYDLPYSEDLAERSIILPLYHPMTSDEIDYVINNIIELIAR